MRIGKSSIFGKGLISTRSYANGALFTTMRGSLKLHKFRTKTHLRIGETWVGIDRFKWIEPRFPVKFINHSCESNAGFKASRRLYATKAIERGQEITIDYSTIDHINIWTLDCNCGSKNCRTIIRAVQYLSVEEFERLLPYIPQFFRQTWRKGF